jgi:hypothetical protein
LKKFVGSPYPSRTFDRYLGDVDLFQLTVNYLVLIRMNEIRAQGRRNPSTRGNERDKTDPREFNAIYAV